MESANHPVDERRIPTFVDAPESQAQAQVASLSFESSTS